MFINKNDILFFLTGSRLAVKNEKISQKYMTYTSHDQ